MKVLLLAGGESSEREVSFDSGRAVFECLTQLKHQVLAIDPGSGQSLLDGQGNWLAQLPSARDEQGDSPMSLSLAESLSAPDCSDVAVVFLVLHGGAGENGAIQNVLELSGYPFTGSDMRASAVAMDKVLTKRICVSLDIPTPRWSLYHVRSRGIERPLFDQIVASFQPPYIVKPNDSGSTVGLTKVESADQLTEALLAAIGESHHILVEDYVEGRELTVAVLDGHAFSPVEIKPKSGLYDYHAKYSKGMSEYVCPAPISDQAAATIKSQAVELYEAIGCSGLARVDFLMDGTGLCYCLELNTLPGMTTLSLAPMAAAAEGIDFEQLVGKVLASALKKWSK